MIPGNLLLKQLNELMPAEMRPVTGLHSRLRRDDHRLGWSRISAFPRFALSFDDLTEWIGKASGDTLESYRARFRHFIASLARAEACYEYRRRPSKSRIAARIDAESADLTSLAAALSEEDGVDIYIPGQGIALLGHDEFGCNLLYVEANHQGRDWLVLEVTNARLYSVRPDNNATRRQ